MRFFLTVLIITAGCAWGFIAPIERPLEKTIDQLIGRLKATGVLSIPFLLYAFYDRYGAFGEVAYYCFIVLCGYASYLLVQGHRIAEEPDEPEPEIVFEDTKPNLDTRINSILKQNRENR